MTDLVLLMGVPSEPPLAMVASALARLRVPHRWFDQRACAAIELGFAVQDGAVSGVIQLDGEVLALEAFGGVYTRLMDHQLLPELCELDPSDARRDHADRLHLAAHAWLEVAPARVVNRSRDQVSNASKPYQAQLIRRFFAVPPTIVTNEPERVLEFREQFGRIVYKSISGSRSVVRELSDADLGRLEHLRTCPVQFQQHIDGFDLRVHTVGAHALFATRIVSDASDYRYCAQLGARPPALAAQGLDDNLAASCLDLAGALGLGFAGIDLRIARDGTAYCLEVNPSPAFSYFEGATGQPISEAVARYLAGI